MTTLQTGHAVTPPTGPARRRIGARPGPGQTAADAGLAQRDPAQALAGEAAGRQLMPIVFLVLFLYVFGGAVAGSTHAYLEQLLPGLVARWPCSPPWAWARAVRGHPQGRVRPVPQPADRPVRAADRRGHRGHGPVLRDDGRAGRVRLAARVPLPHRPAGGAAAFGLAYVFYLAVCWISVLIGLVAPSPETVQGMAFICDRCR